MANVNWERWARAAGIGFVVLFVAGFIVYGDAPKVNASGSDIASFFDGDRNRVLSGLVVIGIGFLVLLWFLGAVANAIREAGEGRLALTVIAMGSTFVAIQAVTGAIAGSLALNIAAIGDEGVLRALNTLIASGDAIAAYPLAGLILAATVGLSRSGVIAPSWYMWFGLVAAILAFLHGTNWATSGFWSATGGYVFVTVVAGLGWTLVTSWLLFRAEARAPERAAVPA